MLDNKSCQCYHLLMLDIQVIDDPAAATVALEPIAKPTPLRTGRARLGGDAGHAGRPGSAEGQLPPERARGARAGAAGRGTQVGRADGTAARRDGRFLRRFAGRPGPGRRRSESGSRSAVRELSHRPGRAGRPRGGRPRSSRKATGKRLATLSVDTEVRFRSATERAAFTEELARSIASPRLRSITMHPHPGGRAHRLVVVAHPLPQQTIHQESVS